MIIAYGSDIHMEIDGQRTLALEPVNVLVLAGDIGKSTKAIDFAASYLDRAEHVVYVGGNHDFWHSKHNYQKNLRLMREYALQYPNLHFLENNTVDIHGVRFIGATAWTDFKYGPDGQNQHMWYAQREMKDYKKITWKTPDGRYGHLRPENILEKNIESKQYIFSELSKYENDPCVVVTHHAPTHLSIPEQFKDDNLNCCYVNTWGEDIAYSNAKLWFHGHIHSPSDYMVYETRVLAAPIGYPGQYADTQFQRVEL